MLDWVEGFGGLGLKVLRVDSSWGSGFRGLRTTGCNFQAHT